MITKTLKVTRREVEVLRCLLYSALRNHDDRDGDYSRLLNKLERLWKKPLYTGSGGPFIPPKLKGK